ncbi:unnamed protein product, partial [Prorocentrum cordatum]
ELGHACSETVALWSSREALELRRSSRRPRGKQGGGAWRAACLGRRRSRSVVPVGLAAAVVPGAAPGGASAAGAPGSPGARRSARGHGGPPRAAGGSPFQRTSALVGDDEWAPLLSAALFSPIEGVDGDCRQQELEQRQAVLLSLLPPG